MSKPATGNRQMAENVISMETKPPLETNSNVARFALQAAKGDLTGESAAVKLGAKGRRILVDQVEP